MTLSLVQLVNQIGKKLEQIGRLDDSQKADALKGAQRGGFIRWHMLSAEQTIISTTHRDGCMDVFPVSVTLEVSLPSQKSPATNRFCHRIIQG